LWFLEKSINPSRKSNIQENKKPQKKKTFKIFIKEKRRKKKVIKKVFNLTENNRNN
jgi:hypothetical protein